MKTLIAASPASTPFIRGSSLGSGSLTTLIKTARRAGAMVGTNRQDDAYADLMTIDGLGDSTRERLGFATHMIAKAKQAGYSPVELWRHIQENFGARNGRPMNLFAADDVQLGTLAFAAGIAVQDTTVAHEIQGYITANLRGRQF